MTLTTFKPGDTVYVVNYHGKWLAQRGEYVRCYDGLPYPHSVRMAIDGEDGIFTAQDFVAVYPTIAEARAAALEKARAHLARLQANIAELEKP